MKKMRHTLPFLLSVALAAVCVSCREGKNGGEGTPNLRGELTLSGLDGEHWTYFSFESGETVGQSDFGDKEQDAAWAGRTDWDLAVCGEYLKTNSGASGSGRGGALRERRQRFESLTEAPSEGYLTDISGTLP